MDAKVDRSNALILAHFQSTLVIVEESLSARSIEYRSYPPLDFSSLCSSGHDSGDAGVWIGLASYFQARALSAAEKSQSTLRIVIAEHHPMASKDQAILDAADSLSRETQVIFHSSLTDSVLRHFGGEEIGWEWKSKTSFLIR